MSHIDLLIRNVRVWPGRGESTIADATIAISQGRIVALGSGGEPPIAESVQTIDGNGATAIPGLCDLHVHLCTNSQREVTINNTVYLTNTPAPAKLLHGYRNGLHAMRAGFTTLRVMGFRGVGESSLRDFIAQGLLHGPRLYVAPWWISMTAGHGDLFFPGTWQRHPLDTADGPTACRRMVREQVREGADFIKVMASGG